MQVFEGDEAVATEWEIGVSGVRLWQLVAGEDLKAGAQWALLQNVYAAVKGRLGDLLLFEAEDALYSKQWH